MSGSDFLHLIEEGRYAELEDIWLEHMASADSSIHDFLNAARALGRKKEKERAGVLLGLLADYYRDEKKWDDQLTILIEIGKHIPESRKWSDHKYQTEDALRGLYSNYPSFDRLMRHFRFYDVSGFTELNEAVGKIQLWLRHDVGLLFYEHGRGVGRVRDLNLNLGLIRLDFESKKDVAVEIGDQDLLPLGPGHILYEKAEKPEELKAAAERDPGETLYRLLRDLQRPLTAGEIKECLLGIISESSWSRWWTAAKKNPRVLVSGKGAQATYQWSESTTAAEEFVKTSFREADIQQRIAIARQHLGRDAALQDYFHRELLAELKKADEDDRISDVVELLDLFSKWPGKESPDPGLSLEDVIRKYEPLRIVTEVKNPNIKTRILELLEGVHPDRFLSICIDWFYHEENPRIQTLLFESLNRKDPVLSESMFVRIFERPFAYPPAFTWVCEQGSKTGEKAYEILAKNLDAKFLLSMITAIDEPAFAAYRSRMKKGVEAGLLINILDHGIEPEAARKVLDLLEHSEHVEDYRRERWANVIRMRVPETKKKEEWIFTTQEALDRKKAELENLVKVELPANRKAVGEAAALGDLSENHEYKAARERQDYLINRLQQLQSDLGRVRMIEPDRQDCEEVRPGTKVTIQSTANQQIQATILGPWDSDPGNSIFSYQSPVGLSMLGKTRGDTFEWNDATWTIQNIEPWTGSKS